MSPEEKQPAEPEKDEAAAAKKPAAKAAGKPAAKKPAAAEKPAAKKPAEKAPAAEKKPAAEKPLKEKPVKEKPPAKPKPEPVAEEPAKQPAPVADPRRTAPVARRAVVRAHARYVRTSARKARMVCGHLRGKSVQEARAILAFTPREVARDWSKLLESAVANAENNHELLEDDLIVREAYADEGPTIKRFRPRAMGRATPIRKRTSHLTITLTPGQAGER
jgi:ribosomal protein L22